MSRASKRSTVETPTALGELEQRLAERDDVARDEALAELARTNAELKLRLAERTIERDDVARDEALAELARTNTELEQRLAERTIERDEIARDEARIELLRTNAELKARLAERTIERDDAARDEALAELARTNAELKQKLAERTIERDEVARNDASTELMRTNYAEEQLRLHAGELEALNAELESFSYSVSHDLRAPVRAVLGYTRAVIEDYGGALDDEGRRLLSVIQSEASRMGDLIDDLLAFSRLGRQPMTTSLVNMTSLVRDVAIEQSGLDGDLLPAFELSELPGVRGDRTLLRQVWVNLISNALKYSSKTANATVRIWAEREADRTVYYIRDNGVGFDMAYASNLFGVFQRLHRSSEFPGTGVGLAIVMRIVQRHGGSVNADAHLGQGATFSFRLPESGGRMNALTGVEILLAEDNQYDAEMTMRALKKCTTLDHVYRVRDGVEALQFVRGQGEFQGRGPGRSLKLLLLDLKMPRLDGLDVLRELKSDPHTKDLPVVIMTSADQESVIKESYRLGVDGFVTKPVDVEAFRDTIAALGMFWINVGARS